jgi:DNA-binding MarR family transcriptional regulator
VFVYRTVRDTKHLADVKPTDEELKTVADLRSALRRFAIASDAVTRAHGLTPRQYDLLAVLHAPGEPPTPSALATSLSLSRSATTELLSRAVEAGLVSRSLDERDGRIKHVAPTEEGSRRYLAAVGQLRSERARLVELLTTAAGLAALLAS